MAKKLREGEPRIEVQSDLADAIEVAVWMLEPGEEVLVRPAAPPDPHEALAGQVDRRFERFHPKVLPMKLLAVSFACLLATALLQAADKPDDKAARLEKARAGLKSADVEVRRKTLGSLNHSDLSDSLIKEMLEMLKDSDGEVRSMAATAVGTHGEAALPGVPALIAQLKGDSHKEARETAARHSGASGKAVKTNRDAVEPLATGGREGRRPRNAGGRSRCPGHDGPRRSRTNHRPAKISAP